MKNKLLIVTLLALFLAALVPLTALAASPTPITVIVHNQTGGQVELSLALPDGSPIFKSIGEGVSSFVIENGVYSYYVQTACGPRSGTWNLGVTKSLYIDCAYGIPVYALVKPEQKIKCDLGMYETSSPPNNLVTYFYPWKLDAEWLLGYAYTYNAPNAKTLDDVYQAFSNQWPNSTYSVGCYDGVAIYDVH